MPATWKTKWGVRRVRRDTPTIEEALIAAESLANDPAQRAEIAASLMGVPVDEVKALAAKQAARTRGRASLVSGPHARRRGRVQAAAHRSRTDVVRQQALIGAAAQGKRRRLRSQRFASLAADGRLVRYWLRAATSVEMTATAIRVSVVISAKSTLRKASATTAEKAAAI